MYISVLPDSPKKISQNTFLINENMTLEWNSGEDREIIINDILVDDHPALSISTGIQNGWIRLRINFGIQEALGLIGIRTLISINKKSRIKPYLIDVNDKNGRYREVDGLNWNRIAINSGQWSDIVGSFLVQHLSSNHHIELIVDLPTDSTVHIANCQFINFSCTKFDQNTVGNTINRSIEQIEPFEARAVAALKSAIDDPVIFSGNFSIENDVLKGWVIIESEKIYISVGEQNKRKAVFLGESHSIYNGFVLKNAAFSEKISDTQNIEIYSKEYGGSLLWARPKQDSLTLSPVRKAQFARPRQDHYILIWAPISISGLTVQLEQITDILTRNKFNFKISYHIEPRISHPLCKHWIDPCDIDQPKMVLYMERFVPFDRGFGGAYKVFYMNLDWLSSITRSIAKVHANVVICPTPYLIDDLSNDFTNSRVVYLPWPSKFKVFRSEDTIIEKKIRILYVGNDYDDVSRKHPKQVVDAILRLNRTDLVFDLKFRARLPDDVRKALQSSSVVDKIIDYSTDHSVVEGLYRTADVNLIPNACEGNGLSILEAWSQGAVPAVLDGHPMIDVTHDDNSFRIPCMVDGHQEHAPLYRTSADQILEFLEKLDLEEVQKKKSFVHKMADDLKQREINLEKSLVSFAMLSGIRTKGIRVRIEKAHLPDGRNKNSEPRFGGRIKDLMFNDEGQSKFSPQVRLVDVVMTTSQRPWCLRQSLDRLLQAMRASPYKHRLTVLCDSLDQGTMSVLSMFSSEIDQLLWTSDRHGLPYMWNTARDILRNTINRTEQRPSYICYIQDDCFIVDPESYFSKMVGIATEAMPGYLGFVSGFYTEVHPGWADFEWKEEPVVASDSIDGKNFMGTPELIESIGPLTWWFSDGTRRGNPGPKRGSHFDLWQWKESENSLTVQSRVSLILPNLCRHIAEKGKESTWNNDTTKESTQDRIAKNKIYNTRTKPE